MGVRAALIRALGGSLSGVGAKFDRMSSSTGTPDVEVRRSRRRRRTVSAYRDGERIVVLIPATMSKRDEATWVADMIARIERQERRKPRSDDDLVARAAKLNDDYLGGLAVPASVRWVANQNARWGSCTPGDRTIRLSDRLQKMPGWVVDYVLVHELAHLLPTAADLDDPLGFREDSVAPGELSDEDFDAGLRDLLDGGDGSDGRPTE